MWRDGQCVLVSDPSVGRASAVVSLVLSPDSKRIASSCLIGPTYTSGISLRAKVPSRLILTRFTVTYSSDGKFISIASMEDRTIQIWGVEAGIAEYLVAHHPNQPQSNPNTNSGRQRVQHRSHLTAITDRQPVGPTHRADSLDSSRQSNHVELPTTLPERTDKRYAPASRVEADHDWNPLSSPVSEFPAPVLALFLQY
ncbi:hypothetical protein BV22DRAFT_388996 [Leucogyrophana mollusca]|uniref:Uncharacterized protein n=1 Tax=Leucogyrophana mollusca TaxID=85980 RepID=A0ACB8BJH5_9AGAM|nr:hypothetical protein BV22DRAFT_388996 [Leucogyrophana mollusca]